MNDFYMHKGLLLLPKMEPVICGESYAQTVVLYLDF